MQEVAAPWPFEVLELVPRLPPCTLGDRRQNVQSWRLSLLILLFLNARRRVHSKRTRWLLQRTLSLSSCDRFVYATSAGLNWTLTRLHKFNLEISGDIFLTRDSLGIWNPDLCINWGFWNFTQDKHSFKLEVFEWWNFELICMSILSCTKWFLKNSLKPNVWKNIWQQHSQE